MNFMSGDGTGQQVIDVKRIGKSRRERARNAKGQAWLFTAFAAQLLQPVTLKGGDEVFDDLELRAFEP